MQIAIIGTGFIGTTLGHALAGSGHEVTFGSRHPEDSVATADRERMASIGQALAGTTDAVILALPGNAVADLTASHRDLLDGRLVIDATNRMGEVVANGRPALPPTVRYARAFNTLGGENMADPEFAGGRADMFFSAPEGDRTIVEAVIAGVGLRPVYVGADREALIDALFQLWIALAMQQGRGRRLAFKLLEG